jgi:hypothetical protein
MSRELILSAPSTSRANLQLRLIRNRKLKDYMAPRVLEAAKVVGEPDEFEYRNVHTIYDEIAPHFSSTRYKVSMMTMKYFPVGPFNFVRVAVAYHREFPFLLDYWMGRIGFWHWEWQIPAFVTWPTWGYLDNWLG